MKPKTKISTFKMIFLGFNAFLLLIVSAAGGYYVVRILTKASNCYTRDQVQSDSRCLYIYQTSVYEKGTRAAPHHDIPCGTDVTSIIPQSHILDKVGHLDPNYQGDVCAASTSQPTPTTAPISTPAPTATPTIAAPTATPTPTAAAISNTTSVSVTPTPTRSISTTPTPTFIPLNASNNGVSPTNIFPSVLPTTGNMKYLILGGIPVALVLIGFML